MNKFNKNCLVFVFALSFILLGFCGKTFPNLIDHYTEKRHDVYSEEFKQRFISIWDASHESIDEKLGYYEELLDLNSIKDNLLGTRIVTKGSTLVKTDSGKLHKIDDKKITDDDFNWATSQIKRVQVIAESSGAQFLYCAMPTKGYMETMPSNAMDYSRENYTNFLSALENKEIPYVDLSCEIVHKGVKQSDIFFNTDHHWRIKSSFLAYQAICEQLNIRYGFDYSRAKAELSNYSITMYPNLFLGSWGQKVGAYFSWLGRDDFDLIVPKFKTSYCELQPFKNESKSGSFKEVVLSGYQEDLKKNDNSSSTYEIYGGSYRLQILVNQDIQNKKKVLMIRDSFGQPIGDFMSTQIKEIHMCDVRNHIQYIGDKINIEKYIEKIHPDFVIICYSGVNSREESFGYYDFF